LSNEELEKIREKIKKINLDASTGINSKSMDKTFDLIIAIQVHSRADFLKYLTETISKITNLHEGNNLIIFSHDIWHEEMNDVTDNISFMPNLNIFYPKSTLFYKDEFPAMGKNDCLVKQNHADAKSKGCTNWEWPDTFGSYRYNNLYLVLRGLSTFFSQHFYIIRLLKSD
jgi:hypothetical protein